jgi:hypothetical protein
MIMLLERVELMGFRSFKDLVAFDFDKTPGVVRLGGRNDDEPLLGANGAGKSSLWDGVFWVLTGKTATGLRGPDVATWNAGRGCYGLVRIAGRTLVRTWGNSNTLTLDKQDVTQEQVFEWLGLTAEQLLCCTYIAQHAPSFLDIGPTEKTDLLSTVLNVDSWLARAHTAEAELSKASRDLRAVETDAARLQGEHDALSGKNYDALIEAWNLEHQHDVSDALERVEKANNVRAQAMERRGLAAVEAGDSAALRKRAEAAEDVVRDARRALTEATIQRNKAAEALRGADAGACRACSRPFPHTHTEKELADLKLQRERAVLVEETRAQAVTAAERVRDGIRTAQQEAAGILREAEAAIDRARTAQTQAEDALSAARAAKNPYLALREADKTRLEGISNALASLADERDVLEAHCARVKYWVKGFKDVRLFVITEALAQLEVEVNACLAQVGLPSWTISFSPDSETKSGTVRRGFAVMVKSPSNPRPVPWAVWSGGEAQRLRAATTMGLSNLIAAYTGFQPFIEVWDEATAGMSVEGIQDFLTAIQHRARTMRRQIWVVDHRALESGVFSKAVVAVKSSGTTKLEVVDNGQGE